MMVIRQIVIPAFVLCRVGAGMDRLKRTYRHLRVYLRRFHAGMAQHRLYPPQVGTVLQHLCCHRVTEQVAAPVRNQPGGFHIVADDAGNAVRPQPRHTIQRHEQRLTVWPDQQPWPYMVQVTLYPPQRTFTHRYHAVLLSLTLDDGQRPAVRLTPNRCRQARPQYGDQHTE